MAGSHGWTGIVWSASSGMGNQELFKGVIIMAALLVDNPTVISLLHFFFTKIIELPCDLGKAKGISFPFPLPMSGLDRAHNVILSNET